MMKKLLSSENRTLLHLLKDNLAENGIETLIKNEYPPAAGEIPPIMASPELWVIQDDKYQQAMSLVNENSLATHKQGTPWQCSQCGEQLSSEFNICWKCGMTRIT